MKATAIIGACWGDEGKGLMTDFFSDANTIVIRYNGGAQAGHTVVRDGKRHVFHHFGSGTLAGAETFLSQFFINNPILFLKELETLKDFGLTPKVYVDEISKITTPWDMMINQIVEETRGTARHGSCGVGINETMKRNELGSYQLNAYDLQNPDKLRNTLEFIQDFWVPVRLEQLNLKPSDQWMENLNSKDILNTYMDQCAEFLTHVTLENVAHEDLFKNKNIVFEGAQGLLLDEDHYFFPHVTHSHTGLKNIVTLAEIMEISELNIVYVTRAYATRHGAGPFPREVQNLSYIDDTNVPNMFQGTLRFGHLDIDLLKETIDNDLNHVLKAIEKDSVFGNSTITWGLAITCVDQIDSNIEYWHEGMLHRTTDWHQLINHAMTATNSNRFISYVSFGKSADEIFSVESCKKC